MQQRFVPLPEVGEHTDNIVIDELGLPIGFDIEELELNVPRIERIVRLANSDHLTVAGYRGDVTQTVYGFNGTTGDGTASASAARITSRASLQSSSAERDNTPNYPRYNTHRLSVRINNAEVEEKIRSDGDKWDRGVWDSQGRAKYMNAALQRGLSDAALKAILGDEPRDTLVKSAFKKSIEVSIWSWLWGISYKNGFLLDTGLKAMLPTVVVPATNTLRAKYGKEPIPLHFSFASHITYDRLVLAATMSHASRLIRAKKSNR